jgi:hypothetical protein
MTLTFGLVTPKLIGVFFSIWILSYAPETVFSFKVIVTFTIDLVTPKSIGVFYPIWTIIL